MEGLLVVPVGAFHDDLAPRRERIGHETLVDDRDRLISSVGHPEREARQLLVVDDASRGDLSVESKAARLGGLG